VNGGEKRLWDKKAHPVPQWWATGLRKPLSKRFCRTNLGASPHRGFEPMTSGGRTNMDIPYVLPTAPVTPGFMTVYPEPDIYAAYCLGNNSIVSEYTCSGHETRMTIDHHVSLTPQSLVCRPDRRNDE